MFFREVVVALASFALEERRLMGWKVEGEGKELRGEGEEFGGRNWGKGERTLERDNL